MPAVVVAVGPTRTTRWPEASRSPATAIMASTAEATSTISGGRPSLLTRAPRGPAHGTSRSLRAVAPEPVGTFSPVPGAAHGPKL